MKTPDHIQQRPISELSPYARNARTHSEAQVAQIAASIREFGFTNPVLVDCDGGIIAGHGRVMAAQQLGMETVPCIELNHLTEAQKRAYILADNKLALNAGWDDALLALELGELKDMGFDLGLTGFGSIELDGLLLGGEVSPPPEVIPEPPAVPVSALGDIWQLGNHRIRCGDSCNPTDVKALLMGETPPLMVTDPPYGVEYDPSWRNKVGINKNKKKSGKVLNDDRADWREAWALFPGDVAYVWHADRYTRDVIESLQACGFEQRAMIIWSKDRFVLGRSHYHWQHEPAWYVVRKGKTGHWNGDRSQSTVWNIPARDDGGHGHGTQKPVECMRRPIVNNSERGDAVYEPFSGSGTTIIACEETGRRCFAMELNPAYVDVAVLRWQQLTGRKATLEGDGRTYDEVTSARR